MSVVSHLSSNWHSPISSARRVPAKSGMSRGSVGRMTGVVAIFGLAKGVPGRHSDWMTGLQNWHFAVESAEKIKHPAMYLFPLLLQYLVLCLLF